MKKQYEQPQAAMEAYGAEIVMVSGTTENLGGGDWGVNDDVFDEGKI